MALTHLEAAIRGGADIRGTACRLREPVPPETEAPMGFIVRLVIRDRVMAFGDADTMLRALRVLERALRVYSVEHLENWASGGG